MRKVCNELMPVLEQLLNEGHGVYSYDYGICANDEITGLFWYEGGRVLDIQGSTWRNEKYNRDCFTIGVCYVPSHENGSGCGLIDNSWGISAEDLLKYRHEKTWVKGITNYKHMGEFLRYNKQFKPINRDGYFA